MLVVDELHDTPRSLGKSNMIQTASQRRHTLELG